MNVATGHVHVQFPTDPCASYRIGWRALTYRPWGRFRRGERGRKGRREAERASAVWREGELTPLPCFPEPHSHLEVALGLFKKQQVLTRPQRRQDQAEQTGSVGTFLCHQVDGSSSKAVLGARLSPSAAWSLVKAGRGGIEGRDPRLSSWWTRDEGAGCGWAHGQ